MALSFTSGIIILFSYFVHVQEWLEATGHKKEIVDLEIAKHKKQWNCTSTPSEPDCGLQVLATGSHPISYAWQAKQHTNLLDRKSHYNLLWLLDSFALHMSGADNTQLTNQHINNNKKHKQQHKHKPTAVRLLVNLCTIVQVIGFFLIIARHFYITSSSLASFIHRYTK